MIKGWAVNGEIATTPSRSLPEDYDTICSFPRHSGVHHRPNKGY